MDFLHQLDGALLITISSYNYKPSASVAVFSFKEIKIFQLLT